MTSKIGIWIDHRRAVLVRMQPGDAEVQEVESDIEKHVRESGGAHGSTPFASQHGLSGNKQDGRYYQHLERYYDRVIDQLSDAESIWVIGPGEAKLEFMRRIERNPALHRKVGGTETADKLTTPQLVALVRGHFQE
jgi:stalled ribosome rescue protein Dom34